MDLLHLRKVPPGVEAAPAGGPGASRTRRAIEALQRGPVTDRVERSRLVEDTPRRRQPVAVDVVDVTRSDRPAGD